jgi:hypothetical protein
MEPGSGVRKDARHQMIRRKKEFEEFEEFEELQEVRVADNALECSLKPIASSRLAFPCDK